MGEKGSKSFVLSGKANSQLIHEIEMCITKQKRKSISIHSLLQPVYTKNCIKSEMKSDRNQF